MGYNTDQFWESYKSQSLINGTSWVVENFVSVVRFQVLTAESMKIAVFRGVKPYSSVEIN
jgi:hypothetical protein